jgi:hypothetical protein
LEADHELDSDAGFLLESIQGGYRLIDREVEEVDERCFGRNTG